MIDLELKDPEDTLGDVLKRMPGERLISVGCHGGYAYEGTVKGFIASEEKIRERFLKQNLKKFRRHLREYTAACNKGRMDECEKLKERMEYEFEYGYRYADLSRRHIVRAYTIKNDTVIALILEGQEGVNGEPQRG